MMPRLYLCYNFIITLFLLCVVLVDTQGKLKDQKSKLVIPLSKTLTSLNKELYGEFVNINGSSTIQIVFKNINENVDFIVFQVHSHLYNVTVYENVCNLTQCTEGRNIGFIEQINKESLSIDNTLFIQNKNENVELKLYVSVHGYTLNDPVPGGCNTEYMIPETPFMFAFNYGSHLFIDVAAPQYKEDPNCLSPDISVDFYMLYMEENNYDSVSYFTAIRSMMTKEGIILNGRNISRTKWTMRRMVSSYTGTGVVYAAIATVGDAYSVYIPVQTYACSPLVEDDCDLMVDYLTELMCSLLFFIGLFLCYYGHKFFRTQLFFVGVMSGTLVAYILLSLIFDVEPSARLFASVFTGVCLGVMRIIFWYLYEVPVFSLILPSMTVGFLFASTLYYLVPATADYLSMDLNFWTLFVFIMTLVAICLLLFNTITNIICCGVLGAFAAVYPIDYYLGSNLKYIIINTVRRATVKRFNYATLMQTFQWRDSLITTIFVIFAATGVAFQYYQNRGRPPFPPPPRRARVTVEPEHVEPAMYVHTRATSSRLCDEKTPLIGTFSRRH